MLKSLIAAAVTLAVPTVALVADDPDTRLQKVTEGRVAGKPTRCINASSVTSSEIIDGRAIVYRIGSRVYVNQPRSGAEALRRDHVLVNRVYGGLLCSIDTISLVDRSSWFARRFIVLGDFVPYTKPRHG